MAEIEVARALEMVHDLSPEDKQALCNAIGRRSRNVTDTIQLMTVTALLLVLLGAFAGVIWFVYTSRDAGIVLAMFTAVLGYLAGLFSPSPIDTR